MCRALNARRRSIREKMRKKETCDLVWRYRRGGYTNISFEPVFPVGEETMSIKGYKHNLNHERRA
jgi:hypothetical protein